MRKCREQSVMGQEGCGEESKWNSFSHIFIPHIYLALAVCQILFQALETQTTQRPSPSGFTFTEGMLLILYGVCVLLLGAKTSQVPCVSFISSRQLFSVSQCNLHVPLLQQSTTQGSHTRMGKSILHPLISFPETYRGHVLHFKHCLRS